MVEVNDDIGSIDYVVKNKEDEKKLLRVIVDSHYKASKIYMDTLAYTWFEDSEV